MKDLAFLKHNLYQRIDAFAVLTRAGDLIREDLNTTMSSMYDPSKNFVIKGGKLYADSGWAFHLEAAGFFQQSKDATHAWIVSQESQINLTVTPAVPLDRYDLVEGVYTVVDDNLQDVNTIDPSTGAISIQSLYTNKKVALSVRVKTGNPGAGAAPALDGATAGFILSTVAIPTTIDLSVNYNLKIAVDKGSYVTIDCRGASPSATTLAEIVTAINTALGATIASDAMNYLNLQSTTTGEDSWIELVAPSSYDALNIIFGLSMIPNYYYYNEGIRAYFKIGEVKVRGSSGSIIQSDIKDVDNRLTWTIDQNNTLRTASIYDLQQSGMGYVLQQNTTTAIDLSDYLGTLIIICDPASDITLTLSNYLAAGKKLIVMNQSASKKVTLAGTVLFVVGLNGICEYESDGSSFYFIAPSSQSNTIVVAASDSSPKGKAAADYVCPGSFDEGTINSAIIYANSLANGGKVVLLEGTYNMFAPVNPLSNVNIKGQGISTMLLKSTTITSMFYIANTVSNILIEDMAIDGNGGSFAQASIAYGVNQQDAVERNVRYSNITVKNMVTSGGGNNVIGFNNCLNLINCVATGLSAPASGSLVYGFQSCSNMYNCKSLSNDADSVCVGFKSCSTLISCIGSDNTATAGFGFYLCSNMLGCSGSGNTNLLFSTTKQIANIPDKDIDQISLTVTSAVGGFSLTRAVGFAYQMTNGIWRLRFNLAFTTNANAAPFAIAITNVVFKNVTDFDQACAISARGRTGTGSTNVPPFAYAQANTNDIQITISDGNTFTNWAVSGDIELNAAPGWI